MKHKRLEIIIASIGIIAIITGGSIIGYNKYQNYQKTNPNAVIAVVGKQKITKTQYTELLGPTINGLKNLYGDDYATNDVAKQSLDQAKQAALSQLIDGELLKEKADASGITPSEDDITDYVNKAKDRYKQYAGGTDDAYENYITSNGYTDSTFEQALRTACIANAEIDDLTKDVTVSDDEAQDYYNKNKDNLTVNAGAFVSSIAIPVSDNTDTDKTASDLMQKAKSILASGKLMQDITNMDEFKNAKILYSEPMHIDFDDTSLNADVLKSLKDLKDNQYSDVIKTPSAYTIILKTNTNTDKTTPSFDSAKYQIKNIVLQNKKDQAWQDAINDYKNSVKVKIYDDRL